MTSNGIIRLAANVSKNRNVYCFRCEKYQPVGTPVLAKYRHSRIRRHYCLNCAVLLSFITEEEARKARVGVLHEPHHVVAVGVLRRWFQRGAGVVDA